MWYLWIHSKIQSAKKRNRLATEVWATGNSEASSTTKLISRTSPRNHIPWICALEKEGLTPYHITPLGILYQNVTKTLCCHCLFYRLSKSDVHDPDPSSLFWGQNLWDVCDFHIRLCNSDSICKILSSSMLRWSTLHEQLFQRKRFIPCWKGVPWICLCPTIIWLFKIISIACWKADS